MSGLFRLVGWLVVLRINVDLAIFQPYLDLEAGDNQSLKIQVTRPEIEPRSSCSASQELNHSATTAPSVCRDKTIDLIKSDNCRILLSELYYMRENLRKPSHICQKGPITVWHLYSSVCKRFHIFDFYEKKILNLT